MMGFRRISGRLLWCLLFAAVAAACSCEPAARRLEPVLALEGSGVHEGDEVDWILDFGMVAVGNRVEPEVEIRNAGTATLRVSLEEAIPEPFGLELPGEGIELSASARLPSGFRFAPAEEGKYEALVRLATNEGEGRIREVRLLGQGVDADLVCSPGRVDLGRVVRGERGEGVTTCTNLLDIPLTLAIDPLEGEGASFFFASLPSDTGSAELEPGGSVEILITHYAEVPGVHTATLPVRIAGGAVVERVEIAAETLGAALLVEPAGCLDFGPVELGQKKELSLEIWNYSAEELRITEMVLEGDVRDFGVVSPRPGRPVTLPAGAAEAVELVVAYEPTAPEGHEAELLLRTTDPFQPELALCLRGRSGTAQIACTPSALDFGHVALGMEARRSFTCSNTGGPIGGLEGEALLVHEVGSTSERFHPRLRNPDGSDGPDVRGYSPGESFLVDVTYTPGEEGFDGGEIVLRSSAIGAPELRLEVSGLGRALPPCEFYVQPPSVRFGAVAPGRKGEATFAVVNDGSDTCLLRDLRLSEDSDPAFSLEAVESVEIAAGERLLVEVAFAPSEEGRAVARAEFSISNPHVDQPIAVPLNGTGSASCVEIRPGVLDFGGIAPNRSTRSRLVSVVNGCETERELLSVEIDEDSHPWFQFETLPLLPRHLAPGERFEFEVAYRPDGLVEHRGHVEIAFSEDEEPHLLPLIGRGTELMEAEEVFMARPPKVDVLWVVDNSGSFDKFQDILRENLPAFLQYAVEWGVDFHLAVTTSGISPVGPCPGGAYGGENGRFFPVDNSSARILTSSMRRDVLASNWAKNVMVGTCHDTEMHYEAAKRALSAPLINLQKAPGSPWPFDGNQGFLRDDAALSIILIHDETEDSLDPVADYVEFYRSLKPSIARDTVKVHAISGAKEDSSCSAQACPRCVEGPELTGGVWLDICTPTEDTEAWAEKLSEMSRAAFHFDTTFPLGSQPADVNEDGKVDEADLEVLLDGAPWSPQAPKGDRAWRYDPLRNSIEVSPIHSPDPHSLLTVRYRISCL